MQLEMQLSNEQRVLPAVCAFARETLRLFPLSANAADALVQLVKQAVAEAIDHAYPRGEDGDIKLSIRETHGKLEIVIRDFGLPQDVPLLERQLHLTPANGLVDEMHWLAFGRDGKALQIHKWLHNTSIAGQPGCESLKPFHDDVPRAPDQHYVIRRMRADEAVQVSQLMYRAYGNTYFNADVYYPDRVAAQDAHGVVASFVAVAADGTVVGHYGLEFDQTGPVAEGGQAVVDPAHRSRGLLNQMRDAAGVEARARNLVGLYGDAVAVHTRTQQLHVSHGGHVCGVELGISPKTEKFRQLAESLQQRVTCLLYFDWLTEPASRTVYVPQRHQALIAEIYQNLRCPVIFGTGVTACQETHGTLTVKYNAESAAAFVRSELMGADTLAAIRRAKRDLVERSHAEVVFVELPLTDPATPGIAAELEKDGLGFAGVAPHFSTRGDILRLVYLVEPLQREPIKTLEPFAGRLVDYALAEQQRLRE